MRACKKSRRPDLRYPSLFLLFVALEVLATVEQPEPSAIARPLVR